METVFAVPRYIAKPDTWFDAGTVCFWLCDVVPGQSALFCGVRDGRLDEETCLLTEFDMQTSGTCPELIIPRPKPPKKGGKKR